MHKVSYFLGYFKVGGNFMQAIVQMGHQGQQMPMATLLPAVQKSSCTPHIKPRFHVRFYDFVEICQNDGPCADVLRYFEMRTDWLIDQLRKSHRMAEKYIPHADDLWFPASCREISAGICYAQSHTTCNDRLDDLINLGFIERRFIARAFDVTSRPTVPFYEDSEGVFIVVGDRYGNYESDGEHRNAVAEGYLVEWQYRYCIDKVNEVLAGPFYDPPQPAKRWERIVKRREPQKKGASVPNIYQDATDDATPKEVLVSEVCVQGGTKKTETSKNKASEGHDNTTRYEFATSLPEESQNFSEAPWSPETLVGLASTRHRPGLFEVADDDDDYEAAEALIRQVASEGLTPQQAWAVIDQHIMAMMDGPTWWATKRKGKNLRFGLRHVMSQWATVAESLKKTPWSPLDTVPYVGPCEEDDESPRDHSWIFGNNGPALEDDEIVCDDEQIVESTLTEEDQGDEDLPDETKETDVIIPPTQSWPPQRRGMSEAEFETLFSVIARAYPSLLNHDLMDRRVLSDGSLAVVFEYRAGCWMPVRSMQEWQCDPMIRSAVRDALIFAESRPLAQ
jgi:hypothetical protein